MSLRALGTMVSLMPSTIHPRNVLSRRETLQQTLPSKGQSHVPPKRKKGRCLLHDLHVVSAGCCECLATTEAENNICEDLMNK